jgi:phytoene desaturase
MPCATLARSMRSHTSSAAESKSVIIIGAGPGGLAAAMLLAHAGVNVRVVEKQPHVGGRTSALVHDGFRFDLGPTFFLYPRVLERIYRAVGRNLMNDVPMTRLDPQYRIILGDSGSLLCTPDLDAMAREVAKFNADDAAQVHRFIAENRVKLERFRPTLESAFHGWSDLFKLSMLKLLPTLRPWLSLDGELKRYFSDPRIRLAFSFQSKYLGMSPFNCPSLFSILSYLEYDFGVWHPDGGCSAVSDAMAVTAENLGATIDLNSPVQEILFEGRKAVGVRTATESHFADAVIVNADFAQAMTTLVPDSLRRRWTDARIAKKRFSCSTFMMYLGLDGDPPPLDHHTIYTSNTYQDNLADIESRHVLSDDPSIYVHNPCVIDPSMAPPGTHTLYVLAPVSHLHGNIDWATQTFPFRRTVLKQLEKLGVHDIEKRIRFEKIVTPQHWLDDYDVYRGATFNMAHNLGQMLHLRPHNRFEDLDQVYLVGGGTHPGSGLPVIYESARITARLLLEDFGLDSSWIDADEPAAVQALAKH